MIPDFIFFRQWVFLASFLRQLRIVVQLLYSLVAGISLCFNSGMYSGFALLEEFEVMPSSFRKAGGNNSSAFLFSYYLCFEGMFLLFAGVILPLFFLGRSMGVSATSINTTSISESASNSFFLPGK